MPNFAFIDEDGRVMKDDETGKLLIYDAVDKVQAMSMADQEYADLYRCIEINLTTDEEI